MSTVFTVAADAAIPEWPRKLRDSDEGWFLSRQPGLSDMLVYKVAGQRTVTAWRPEGPDPLTRSCYWSRTVVPVRLVVVPEVQS